MGLACCSLKEDTNSTCNRSKYSKSWDNFFTNSKGKCRSSTECEIRAHLNKKCYMKNRLDTVTEHNVESSCNLAPSRNESVISKFWTTMSNNSQVLDLKDERQYFDINITNDNKK